MDGAVVGAGAVLKLLTIVWRVVGPEVGTRKPGSRVTDGAFGADVEVGMPEETSGSSGAVGSSVLVWMGDSS